MLTLILGIILVAAALGAIAIGLGQRLNRLVNKDIQVWLLYGVSVGVVLFGLVGLGLLLGTSFTVVGADEMGHLKRVYGGLSMPPGQIIAFKGQAGPQAEVLSPGFKFSPLLNVLYKVEKFSVVEIPVDSYGLLLARDGAPLRPGQILADEWPEAEFEKMLEAEYFLHNGGQKGPQLSVLPPGKYRVHRYLFDVVVKPVTNIAIGSVGVVKSNVQTSDNCIPVPQPQEQTLAIPLVPKGCIGVWNEPLLPGRYYLNANAYEVINISTRVYAWEYSGGYERRVINLKLDQEGRITQDEVKQNVPVPPTAVEGAIPVRVEGWTVPIEVRLIVQIAPEDAPFVVAAVGGLTEVEQRILTRTLGSVVRNVIGERGRKVLELQDQRAELEQLVKQTIIPEGRKAGISVKEVRFGDPVIPPELLVTLARRQLAEELEKTYAREQRAQEQRVLTEQARATADQQDQLVAAQVGVQIEVQNKLASQLRGEGREAELTAIARGQDAQVKVLGQDRVLQLEALIKTLEAAIENPNIVKVPVIMVEGSSTGMEGFAAILGGASNLAKGTLFSSQDK
ncbi:MAG: hypothetical protein HY666_00810 [Chloroflexi bacterium]|nr:hypothetical protein [Chloroflexota bacterium]